jgi:hypothetical protein
MPERVGEWENEIVFNGYIINLFNNALETQSESSTSLVNLVCLDFGKAASAKLKYGEGLFNHGPLPRKDPTCLIFISEMLSYFIIFRVC